MTPEPQKHNYRHNLQADHIQRKRFEADAHQQNSERRAHHRAVEEFFQNLPRYRSGKGVQEMMLALGWAAPGDPSRLVITKNPLPKRDPQLLTNVLEEGYNSFDRMRFGKGQTYITPMRWQRVEQFDLLLRCLENAVEAGHAPEFLVFLARRYFRALDYVLIRFLSNCRGLHEYLVGEYPRVLAELRETAVVFAVRHRQYEVLLEEDAPLLAGLHATPGKRCSAVLVSDKTTNKHGTLCYFDEHGVPDPHMRTYVSADEAAAVMEVVLRRRRLVALAELLAS